MESTRVQGTREYSAVREVEVTLVLAPHRRTERICSQQPSSSGVESTRFLYLSESINTAMWKYSVTSRSSEFKMYLRESMKVSPCEPCDTL